MPSNTEQWKAIADQFWHRWNFPNTLGCLDGKHIAICKPNNSGSLHFNYKRSFSNVFMCLGDVQSQSEEAPPKKSNSFSSSGTKKSNRKATFQKSASIPSEQDYIARTKKDKKAAAEKNLSLQSKLENSFDLATKKFDLRTVRSIHQKKKTHRAPLAEIESSKVAEKDSPAVEVPPIDFAHQLNSSPGQRRRYLTSFSIAKTAVKTEVNGDTEGNYKGG
uniref:DDE Tnp4 domain-containing protein n=1 Tax=Ditylenchus dipsaci TaxID=166011 RepID=A0A915D5R0_9BILA